MLAMEHNICHSISSCHSILPRGYKVNLPFKILEMRKTSLRNTNAVINVFQKFVYYLIKVVISE